MPRFRKIPVEIEAFQMTEKNRWSNEHWPNWLHAAWQLEIDQSGCLYCKENTPGLFIFTLEGVHRVDFDDWIIQGVAGELYPCKPEIFEATYVAV